MTASSLPSVSVVIATLNRTEDLRRAMGALLRQTHVPHEVILVDQSESDATRRLIGELSASFSAKGIPLVYFHRDKKSSASARNFGLERASGAIISFLDDDSECCDDYYEKVAGYFAANPSLGGVGGSVIQEKMLRGWKGTLRRAIWRIFLLNHEDGRMTGSGFGYPLYDRPVTQQICVDMLHGCNMNFRRAVVGQERFDEWFTGYSFREDAEFSYRISKKAPVWMVPDARLFHHESPSGRLDVESLKRMEIKNYYYVFSKHKKQNGLTRALFFYSLSGILLMDFFEVLLKRDVERTRKLRAGWAEAYTLFWKGGASDETR